MEGGGSARLEGGPTLLPLLLRSVVKALSWRPCTHLQLQ